MEIVPLEIVLINTLNKDLIHIIIQLRFLCKGVWVESLAEQLCLNLFGEKKGTRAMFDSLYRHDYVFSLDYRHYSYPSFCGSLVTDFFYKVNKVAEDVSIRYGIKLVLDNKTTITMIIRSVDNLNHIGPLKFPKGYNEKHLASITGKVLQSLMIAEDSSISQNTYFFQTRDGAQFPFFLNHNEFLYIESPCVMNTLVY